MLRCWVFSFSSSLHDVCVCVVCADLPSTALGGELRTQGAHGRVLSAPQLAALGSVLHAATTAPGQDPALFRRAAREYP